MKKILYFLFFFLVSITNTTNNPTNKKGITIFEGKPWGFSEELVW